MARHLLRLYQDKRTEEFPALCELIERFHFEGDGFVKELATVGLLEGIQNNWEHDDADLKGFHDFLLPESRKWWKELNDFWAGRIPYLGAGLHNN
ncbi:MAG: hypothetical protein JW888_12345 [Pirellulales bacterium]|nr:hypothetical protein [Pirellulales bacterium]